MEGSVSQLNHLSSTVTAQRPRHSAPGSPGSDLNDEVQVFFSPVRCFESVAPTYDFENSIPRLAANSIPTSLPSIAVASNLLSPQAHQPRRFAIWAKQHNSNCLTGGRTVPTMAERSRFPTDKAEFGEDERISFDQVTQSYKLEDDNGNEWEFIESRSKWVPVVRNPQNSVLSIDRLWPAYVTAT